MPISARLEAPESGEAEPSIAVIRDGPETIGAIPLRWRELYVAPGRRCRIAIITPMLSPSSEITGERAELAYRALLDLLTRGEQPAHIASFELPAEDGRSVDQLWRLAVALCARCHLRERGGRLRVDIVMPGFRGQAGALLRDVLDRELWSGLASRFRAMRHTGSRPSVDGRASLFALDLSREPMPISAPADVVLAEVASEELVRHPGRYGLSLVAARGSLHSTRCYAARIGGEVVFRMYASDLAQDSPTGPYAEALARLPRPCAMIFSALTIPEQRGRSIYPAALSWVAERHRRSGYRALCLTAQLDNPAAVRAAEKAGFRRVD